MNDTEKFVFKGNSMCSSNLIFGFDNLKEWFNGKGFEVNKTGAAKYNQLLVYVYYW